MDGKTFAAFAKTRDNFKTLCAEILNEGTRAGLADFQKRLMAERSGSPYPLENPVLYNTALDGITAESNIKLILIADNPGKKEQLNKNRFYLAGPSGKLAARFFQNHPELQIDFRLNTLIINKTPIHTPRTAELKILAGQSGRIKILIEKSQKSMALLARDFYSALKIPVWVIGYSELKRGGIFEVWTEETRRLLQEGALKRDDLYLFRHFSMNQFSVEFNKEKQRAESAGVALKRIGQLHRSAVFD